MLLPQKSRHLPKKKSVFSARTGRPVIQFIINWLPFTGCQCFGRAEGLEPRGTHLLSMSDPTVHPYTVAELHGYVVWVIV